MYSKIRFEYSKGHNSWGDTGLYSTSEIIEMVPVSKNQYKIALYLNVLSYASPGRYWKDTTKLKTTNYKPVDGSKVDTILKQLNTAKQNFNIDFIRPHLKQPTKQQIIKLAKLRDLYYKLKDEDEDDTKIVVNKLKRFDKLDSFITTHKPSPNAMVVMDAWKYSRLRFINNKDTLTYQNQFLELLGQPFENLTKNKNHQAENGVINLEINTSLGAILPKSSLLKAAVEINNLTEEYIKWYLEKVL